MEARGDFIGGEFFAPEGDRFASRNPARDGATVLETAGSPARVRRACAAAAEAAPGWARLSFAERLELLHRFRDALKARSESLAEAISLEMGKIRSEARVEIDSLVGRFASVEAQIRSDLREGPVPGNPQEVLRYHPHGVVGVIGPFNFPLHLCHVHVVPALMLGNAVVVKPSEVTPLAGQRYAEAAQAAGLPPGVLNVVHGTGAVGAALAKDEHLRALAFTGSWATGRRIAESLLDRPEVLLALEMGGKNACVVREDADLRAAVHEITTSGYLTTGQRCTCADRLLVHRSRADELVSALDRVLGALRFGDPEDPASFAGPLASEGARDRFLEAMKKAREGGAEVVREPKRGEGGWYVTPSIHRLPSMGHVIAGYTDIEIFGPDLCVEVFDDDDEAIASLNDSPYGFAHSVFTKSDAAFERYFRDVEAGIINRDRSTNQASPRLPFGGIKHSGNFRPAGAWAHRNLVYPVAHIKNEGGAFARHAKIVPHLPAIDLDRLEEAHAAEEKAESKRSLLETPRELSVRLPLGGALPRSSELLERFYAGDRYVREKKPAVFDHLRSSGPFYVSVDEQPLSVMDGMSQTATNPAGFAPDRVVRAYVEGELGQAPIASADTTLGDVPEAVRFADKLRELVPGLPTVCFASSGAEANEKAYALCRANATDPDKARRLLAFEGSFHGRTLLALYASYNPSKRVPFQIAGYEVDFAPFPVWSTPGVEPVEPQGFAELCAKGDVGGLEARFGSGDDALLRAEVASLAYVGRTIASGTYFAVDIEPMQSEGGDRYATARFYRGLRLLTRALGVSLIMDEVQAGFGLGGTFFWHQRFGLRDADGGPDTPDCVVFAKRAQVGVCMSRFADLEPTFGFPASLARGLLHAELAADGRDAARIEALVKPRLAELTRRWGHRIESPRATGYAIAFELRDAAELNAYLEQRFWRGVIVFGAGTKTVRYRLNSSFDERTIDLLFESMHRSLAWLDAHPGKSPPTWEDFPSPPAKAPPASPVRVRVADASEADALMPRILEIEAAAYEPARRDDEAHLRKGFAKDGVAVVAVTEDGRVVGSALGTPLENVAEVEGPDRDPMLGRENTLYSMAVTVDPAYQGHGLGRALKLAMLKRAAELKNLDGTERYHHATGRNRLPEAGPMSQLNDSLGAYTVFLLEGQYEGGATARYYRQPLGPFVPTLKSSDGARIDLASGLARPFAEPPASLAKLYEEGGLFGPSVNKITVLNYITPAVVRATEWLAALTPNHPHAYLCSGRDETADKSVRVLRWHRKEAQVVIGLEGGYVGHTTACARSISDRAVHRQGPAHFDWPRVPHPAGGVTESIEALRAAIAAAGAARVLGIYIEPIQERTGRVIPDAYWPELAKLRADTGVPVVLVETASAYYRSGQGAFYSSGIAGFVPDVLTWWTGGQLGVVHVTTPYFVPNPLTLVSTWDGDELSLVQMHHQLRAARSIDIAAASKALDEALAGVKLPVHGRGLYRVIHAGERAQAIVSALGERGVRVRVYPGGRVAIVPALDRAIDRPANLSAAFRHCASAEAREG